jgi:hypothetical protein
MSAEFIHEDFPKAYKAPTMDTPDANLISIASAWFQESKRYHTELERIWKQNEDYYKGKQTFMERVPADMSNTVQNQIFMGIETIVPIITANPPQFIAEPPEESDTSVEYADALQKVLGIHYETKDVRTNGEMLVRHMLIYRYGCWKVYWDEREDDVGLKTIRPQRLYFPKVATELPYIMEQMDITSEEFKEIWGEEKFKEFLTHGGQEFDPNLLEKVAGIWTIWEVWTKDMVFWKYGSIIIDKQENPHYDFNNKKKNHFMYPKIPYIIASVFRLGNSVVGETDLIQQTIPIQDTINVSARLVINNANKTGNAQWFVDNQIGLSEEEVRTKITNAPGLLIYGSGVANPNLLRRDPPPPLPAYIQELKLMAENAFDNIFGTHSTTRGERQSQETLGGRLLLKQADLGRIDLIVREFERCVAELGNWFTQLMKLNYASKRTFRAYGETGITFVKLMKDMIEEGIKVIIKSGTTLPTDELSKRREAVELWGMGALDPVTLFERLKFSNPEEAAQRLQAWRMNQLKMEAQIQGTVGQQPTGGQGRQTQPLPSPQREVGKMEGKITK